MPRFSFTLVLLLALLGLSENTQGQSRITEIEPAVPSELQLGTDLVSEDAARTSEADGQADEDLELDGDLELDDDLDLEGELDSDYDADEKAITPQRLTDDRIRSNWPKHSIATIGLSLDESGRVPEDRSSLIEGFGRVSPISDTVKVFGWEAPNIRYQPLYFEDVALERYGQTLPDYRQSVRSAIHFGKSLTGLAFQMHETPPRSCDSSLGYCRPGTCVPQTTQRHFFGALSLR